MYVQNSVHTSALLNAYFAVFTCMQGHPLGPTGPCTCELTEGDNHPNQTLTKIAIQVYLYYLTVRW